jgi:cellulose synthase/poly-beta-1,6-N-acetylglucosamine synthase-like glycosyltransferase
MNKLKELGGWDSYNVTEDLDLGIRIAESGYKTIVVNSTTYEEATTTIRAWVNQRSRWLKGKIQSFFVHSRALAGKKLTIKERLGMLSYHYAHSSLSVFAIFFNFVFE